MGVVKVYRTFEESVTSSDTPGESWSYLVEFDDKATPLASALTASVGGTAIPHKGTVSGGLTVTQVEARRDRDNPTLAQVTVTWGIPSDGGGGGSGGEGDPGVKWNATISVEGVEFRETVTQDKDGKNIENSAKQPFDPPLEQTYYDEQVTVSFNSWLVDLNNIEATRGKINSASVTMTVNGLTRTFAAKTLKLTAAKYTTTVGDGGQTYWDIDYTLLYRKDGWKRKVVDRGYYERIGGKLIQIKDQYGEPVTSPSYLDGTGKKLSQGADAVLKEFELDKDVSFTGLFTGL